MIIIVMIIVIMIIIIIIFIYTLVGGFNPSEKISVNWDDYSQYMEK